MCPVVVRIRRQKLYAGRQQARLNVNGIYNIVRKAVYIYGMDCKNYSTSGVGDGSPLFPGALLHFNVAEVKDSRDGLEHGHLLFVSEPQGHHCFLYTYIHAAI